MHQLKCSSVAETGCNFVASGETKEKVVEIMMKHGGEKHADLMKATTPQAMQEAKQQMEKKMYSLLK